MRLQAESRRQSAAPGSLDLSRAGISGFTSPPSSKRASFTPLTGRSNSHRRVSSISVDGNGLGVLHLSEPNPSPNGQLSFQDTGLAPPSSRRSLFRHSPPSQDIPLPSTTPPPAEVEALRKEVENLKKELSDARAEVSEANEAKEASEICVKALREFIAENQVGASTSDELSSVKLPPPPAMTSGEEIDSSKKAAPSSSGWGFKLWKADNTPKPPASAPVLNTSVTSSTATTSSSASAQQTPTASAPFSRLGGFFSSRASVSSTTSSNSALQTNAALTRDSFRDSISGHSVSVSDTSSLIEPASPEQQNRGCVKIVVASDAGELAGVDAVMGVPVGKEQGMAISMPTPPPAAVVG